MNELLLFTTSVQSASDVARLQPALNASFAGRWHFDLWEAARYLRLIGGHQDVAPVQAILNRHGFVCEEVEADICVPAMDQTRVPVTNDVFQTTP